MPISNGDAMPNTTTANALDYTKALEVLKNEYPERDGIDVKTLIDSKKNGGLTYNDFLMLPGYIGALLSHSLASANLRFFMLFATTIRCALGKATL
jgi:hypothetical protein